MLLLGVKKEGAWLMSTFNLTYGASWEMICKAVSKSYDYFENVEVLVDDIKKEISSKDEILGFDESRNMTIRGMSKTIQVPVMMTFYNQVKTVNVTVACATDEFKEADYHNFNMSMGQFMDSVELAMYM